jgi:hypothetical protein
LASIRPRSLHCHCHCHCHANSVNPKEEPIGDERTAIHSPREWQWEEMGMRLHDWDFKIECSCRTIKLFWIDVRGFRVKRKRKRKRFLIGWKACSTFECDLNDSWRTIQILGGWWLRWINDCCNWARRD